MFKFDDVDNLRRRPKPRFSKTNKSRSKVNDTNNAIIFSREITKTFIVINRKTIVGCARYPGVLLTFRFSFGFYLPITTPMAVAKSLNTKTVFWRLLKR